MSQSEAVTAEFPVEALRARFPALRETGDRELFFDNAAGAQVPDEVFEAMRAHLVARHVRSQAVDRAVEDARGTIARFLNAASPDEIVFGLNTTSLTRMVADAA